MAVTSTTAAGVKPGEPVTAAVSKLDLTSLGSPVNTALEASFTDSAGTVTQLGTVPVASGAATVNLAVPAGAAEGGATLVLTAVESGTVVNVAVLVGADTPSQPVCVPPVKPTRPADLKGQANYGQAMAAYRACLRG